MKLFKVDFEKTQLFTLSWPKLLSGNIVLLVEVPIPKPCDTNKGRASSPRFMSVLYFAPLAPLFAFRTHPRSGPDCSYLIENGSFIYKKTMKKIKLKADYTKLLIMIVQNCRSTLQLYRRSTLISFRL